MLAFLFVAQVYFGFARAAYEEGVVRMDDNFYYFNYQDIINATNLSKPPWVYGHNIEKEDSNDEIVTSLFKTKKTCIYFRKENLNETHVNFTKHYKDVEKKDDNMTSERLYGHFFTTPGMAKENSAPANRSAPNGIAVSKQPGGTPHAWFKLIFSDNRDCSIIRPFSLEQFKNSPLLAHPDTKIKDVPGLSYYAEDSDYKSTEGRCIVLLSDDKARKGGFPARYKNIYESLCGKRPQFKVVFDENCPRIPNILGC